MKYAWIDAQRREFPLPDMCEVLAVSISGYRVWHRGSTPDRTRLTEPQAVALIKSIHAEVKAGCGSRRMLLTLTLGSPPPPTGAMQPNAGELGAMRVVNALGAGQLLDRLWMLGPLADQTFDSRHAAVQRHRPAGDVGAAALERREPADHGATRRALRRQGDSVYIVSPASSSGSGR